MRVFNRLFLVVLLCTSVMFAKADDCRKIVFAEYQDTIWVSSSNAEIVYSSKKTGAEYKYPKVRVSLYGDACRTINKTDLERLINGAKQVGVIFKNYKNGERKIIKVIAK